jgi:hypothetical protein
MKRDEKTFIFTEAYNCGKIARVAIESFLKYHPKETVNVFGKKIDFKEVGIDSLRVNYIPLDDDITLKNLYVNGHAGTSYIHAGVLLKKYGEYKNIIHFDSDVLFRDECISDITKSLEEGYSLVGQRRNYEKNRGGVEDIGGKSLKGIPDTIGTCFFGMDLESLTIKNFETVMKMCVGGISLTGEPILDYFDPVSFHVMKNGGKVKYLPNIDYGGGDHLGNWDNGFYELNLLCDFGKKLVHFAGVGSGLNFKKNGSGNVPKTYSSWAKERYNLYSMLFCGENIGPYDENAYKKMKTELEL